MRWPKDFRGRVGGTRARQGYVGRSRRARAFADGARAARVTALSLPRRGPRGCRQRPVGRCDRSRTSLCRPLSVLGYRRARRACPRAGQGPCGGSKLERFAFDPLTRMRVGGPSARAGDQRGSWPKPGSSSGSRLQGRGDLPDRVDPSPPQHAQRPRAKDELSRRCSVPARRLGLSADHCASGAHLAARSGESRTRSAGNLNGKLINAIL